VEIKRNYGQDSMPSYISGVRDKGRLKNQNGRSFGHKGRSKRPHRRSGSLLGKIENDGIEEYYAVVYSTIKRLGGGGKIFCLEEG